MLVNRDDLLEDIDKKLCSQERRILSAIDKMDEKLDNINNLVVKHEQNFKIFGNILSFTGMSGVCAIFIGVYNFFVNAFKQ